MRGSRPHPAPQGCPQPLRPPRRTVKGECAAEGIPSPGAARAALPCRARGATGEGDPEPLSLVCCDSAWDPQRVPVTQQGAAHAET